VFLSHNAASHNLPKGIIMTQREIISEPVLNSQSNFNSADFLKEAMAKNSKLGRLLLAKMAF
jgi:hypothetical protein